MKVAIFVLKCVVILTADINSVNKNVQLLLKWLKV